MDALLDARSVSSRPHRPSSWLSKPHGGLWSPPAQALALTSLAPCASRLTAEGYLWGRGQKDNRNNHASFYSGAIPFPKYSPGAPKCGGAHGQ